MNCGSLSGLPRAILDSSNNTLKSAFSQYHIDTNSDNNTIYRIYMG